MNVGEFRHLVTVKHPTRAGDGDGGYTESFSEVSPASTWWCSIEPSTAGKMDRLAASNGAITSRCSHILHGRYHEDITTQVQLVEGARTFNVLGAHNIGEEDRFTRVFAEEVVT